MFSVMINGEIEGYFSGGRGLRQGDPVSPLLFVMCMEYWSRMMRRNTKNGSGFRFHKGCKVIDLNHLCFADDMFIFCNGDVKSIQIIKETMQGFSSTSGLSPNLHKSTIFFNGVNPVEKAAILRIIGFQEGDLPVKYLGLPLISTRLSKTHCNSLIQRITSRVNSWSAKSLSYAGKLQLINSVLLSMQIYWCTIFLLPKAVIKGVEAICRNFLWNSSNTNRRHGLVNWNNVCSDKKAGGLGVKSILTWNMAALVKHIWGLVSQKATLWARWVSENKLKRLSFWGIEKPHDCSWAWRKILLIRDKVKHMFSYNLGDGESFSFWHDPWVNGMSIRDKFPEVSFIDADIPKRAKVADCWRNNKWNLPDPMDQETQNAWKYLEDNFKVNQHAKDKISWKGSKNGIFTVNSAWKNLTPAFDRVPWYSTIWYAGSIPRHSFVTWLAIKGRLKTKAKLMNWGVIQSSTCCLCNSQPETIDHLFFECSLSSKVWERVLRLAGEQRKRFCWRREISFLTRRAKGRSKKAKDRRLWFNAAVYHLWKARNDMVFNSKTLSAEIIVSRIVYDVKARSS